jgi:RNA polymerase sigma-70 factor (ECF subfamily)
VLAGRASRGDVQAFESLVDRYQKVVFNLTLRMTGNRQDARELTQDVFVRAWRGLHGFDTRLRFFSWIYRIAIHACLNLRRSTRRREPLEWEPESGDPEPDQQAEAHELERKVHEALGRLPTGDRQLLVLRHFLDRSHEEIAEVLGVPAMRVKSRLFTARQRLRRELEQRGLVP